MTDHAAGSAAAEPTGVHHFGLTVTDVDASARWYCDTLGFETISEYRSPDGSRRKLFLRHPNMDFRLGLVQHSTRSRGRFDETNCGLDHVAFRVRDRGALDTWEGRLRSAGVDVSPVANSLSIPGAAVLVFRDPDNIQIEFFAEPDTESAG